MSAFWIWCAERPQGKEACFFRNCFTLEKTPSECPVQVSADSVYTLYVNGKIAARGPRKGDAFRHYYDVVDLAPYLETGENIIAAKVFHFPSDPVAAAEWKSGPSSLITASLAGFWLNSDDERLSTGAHWRVWGAGDALNFEPTSPAGPAPDMSKTALSQIPSRFFQKDFDGAAFREAVVVCDTGPRRYGRLNPMPLAAAPLPAPVQKHILPQRIVRSNIPVAETLLATGKLEIPPGGPWFVEIDMGFLTTAYVCFHISYGEDMPAEMALRYAESYYRFDENGKRYKGDRASCENAVLLGECDTLLVNRADGFYETPFFRTFRYLRLEIQQNAGSILLDDFKLWETHYPLEIQGCCARPLSYKKLWSISARTLLLCMHDTYEDCPYYEQLQYIMDTVLSARYTYYISADDRLARAAIDMFSAGRMPDGMLNCCFPCKYGQVIPGFGLYYIQLLYDHYLYYGDKALVCRYFSAVDSVLQYFIARLDPNTGFFPRSQYWEFVDWVQKWDEWDGVPIGPDETVNTIYHEMFVYFLRKAARLCDWLGRGGLAGEYRAVAEQVARSVRAECYDTVRGVFMDTVGRLDASAHAQIWAVLAGIVDGEAARTLMERVMNDHEMPRCSYSMTFFLLRALEQTGLYDAYSEECMKPWHTMLCDNLSTWCEDPVTQRSDCHAWSCLPLYEFGGVILGVRPAEPGYERIRIAPSAAGRDCAEGSVATRKGLVKIRWEKRSNGAMRLEAETPPGIPVEVKLNGEIVRFHAGGHISV